MEPFQRPDNRQKVGPIFEKIAREKGWVPISLLDGDDDSNQAFRLNNQYIFLSEVYRNVYEVKILPLVSSSSTLRK